MSYSPKDRAPEYDNPYSSDGQSYSPLCNDLGSDDVPQGVDQRPLHNNHNLGVDNGFRIPVQVYQGYFEYFEKEDVTETHLATLRARAWPLRTLVLVNIVNAIIVLVPTLIAVRALGHVSDLLAQADKVANRNVIWASLGFNIAYGAVGLLWAMIHVAMQCACGRNTPNATSTWTNQPEPGTYEPPTGAIAITVNTANNQLDSHLLSPGSRDSAQSSASPDGAIGCATSYLANKQYSKTHMLLYYGFGIINTALCLAATFCAHHLLSLLDSGSDDIETSQLDSLTIIMVISAVLAAVWAGACLFGIFARKGYRLEMQFMPLQIVYTVACTLVVSCVVVICLAMNRTDRRGSRGDGLGSCSLLGLCFCLSGGVGFTDSSGCCDAEPTSNKKMYVKHRRRVPLQPGEVPPPDRYVVVHPNPYEMPSTSGQLKM